MTSNSSFNPSLSITKPHRKQIHFGDTRYTHHTLKSQMLARAEIYITKGASNSPQMPTIWGRNSPPLSREPWISHVWKVPQTGWLLCHWRNMISLFTKVPLWIPLLWEMGRHLPKFRTAMFVELASPSSIYSPAPEVASLPFGITKSETSLPHSWVKFAMMLKLSQTFRK